MASDPIREEEIIADINVTPLVDVALVLLVIFMVTASVIMTPAIKVDLPHAANAEQAAESTVALVLTHDGTLYLNGQKTNWHELKILVRAKVSGNRALQAVISADKRVSHGDVIRLIDTIKGLGIVHFALNIERVSYDADSQG